MPFTPRFVDLVRNYDDDGRNRTFVLGAAGERLHRASRRRSSRASSFYYSCDRLRKPAEREVGRGTMQADGTISREPIGGTLTDFTSGTKTIALISRGRMVREDRGGAWSVAGGCDADRDGGDRFAGGPARLASCGKRGARAGSSNYDGCASFAGTLRFSAGDGRNSRHAAGHVRRDRAPVHGFDEGDRIDAVHVRRPDQLQDG